MTNEDIPSNAAPNADADAAAPPPRHLGAVLAETNHVLPPEDIIHLMAGLMREVAALHGEDLGQGLAAPLLAVGEDQLGDLDIHVGLGLSDVRRSVFRQIRGNPGVRGRGRRALRGVGVHGGRPGVVARLLRRSRVRARIVIASQIVQEQVKLKI